MDITKNIEGVKDKIVAGNLGLARDISLEATEAIMSGIGSAAWNTLMKRFASDDDQLRRLSGNDEVFNRFIWAKTCLAYIAGDANCGEPTTMTGLGGTMMSMRLRDKVAHTRMEETLNKSKADLEALYQAHPEYLLKKE
jgi:hypothetical protein